MCQQSPGDAVKMHLLIGHICGENPGSAFRQAPGDAAVATDHTWSSRAQPARQTLLFMMATPCLCTVQFSGHWTPVTHEASQCGQRSCGTGVSVLLLFTNLNSSSHVRLLATIRTSTDNLLETAPQWAVTRPCGERGVSRSEKLQLVPPRTDGPGVSISCSSASTVHTWTDGKPLFNIHVRTFQG